MWDTWKTALLEKKRGKAEWITLGVWLLYILVISYFHEPWFDEAQSWCIAKSASLYEMLFKLPHYEGHTPVWWLILAPFAKLGAPYELSLLGVNLVFTVGLVLLLLFRSPFPRVVRCAIPFTYYFIFQYSIYSRPYSMVGCCFLWVACQYRHRKEKPLAYTISLVVLALSHTFGLLFCGGFCIVWLIEILEEYQSEGRSFRNMGRDKRLYCGVWLVLQATLEILMVWPADNIYYGGMDATILERVTSMFPFYTISLVISILANGFMVEGTNRYIIAAIGIVLLLALCRLLKENDRCLLFLIPYLLFTSFFVWCYGSWYHMGLVLYLLLFVFWVILEERGTIQLPPFFVRFWNRLSSRLVRGLAYLLAIVCGLSSTVVGLYLCWIDVTSYCSVQEIVAYLKDNNLTDCNILVAWKTESASDATADDQLTLSDIIEVRYMTTELLEEMELQSSSPSLNSLCVAMRPYFDENIFMNFNVFDPVQWYMDYKIDSEEEQETFYAVVREQGIPDVIIGRAYYNLIYTDGELDDVTYYAVAYFEFGCASQGKMLEKGSCYVYVREDLLEEYGLTWMFDPELIREEFYSTLTTEGY